MRHLIRFAPIAVLAWLMHLIVFGADAARMLDKYMRRTQAAGQDYVTGVQNPKRNPKQAALAAAGKYKQRVIEAANAGLYEAGIRSYDEAAAIAAATGDGGAAYVAGIQKRGPKISAAFTDLAPRLNAVSQQVQSMPQDSEEQRTQRMIRNLQLMRGLKKQRGGRGYQGG
jgi:hypothetical protein